MQLADKKNFNYSKPIDRNHDTRIMLGYLAFALIVMILIYASSSSVFDTAEFSSMTVLP